MKIRVLFHAWFRDLAGCPSLELTLPEGTTVGGLHAEVLKKFPALEPMKKSTLIAVGIDYQGPDHVLADGSEVSFFPPVSGG